jgi:hypothetical protein
MSWARWFHEPVTVQKGFQSIDRIRSTAAHHLIKIYRASVRVIAYLIHYCLLAPVSGVIVLRLNKLGHDGNAANEAFKKRSCVQGLEVHASTRTRPLEQWCSVAISVPAVKPVEDGAQCST